MHDQADVPPGDMCTGSEVQSPDGGTWLTGTHSLHAIDKISACNMNFPKSQPRHPSRRHAHLG